MELSSEKNYVWRILVEDESKNKRLIVPNSDPEVYEFAFDFIFNTVSEAEQALVHYDVLEQAISENWILCFQEIIPVSFSTIRPEV
jgi:hypothetical protein